MIPSSKILTAARIANAVSVVTIIAGSTMFLYGWRSEPQAPLLAFLSLQASLSGQSAPAVTAGSSVTTAVGLIWWGITIAACGFFLMVMRYRMNR